MVSPPSPDGHGPAPSEIFARFLGQRERGEEVDIEALVQEYPHVGAELRELHSDHSRFGDLRKDADLAVSAPGVPGADPIADARAFVERVVPGQVLGEFRLVRLLGEGSMGQVWEAEQPALDRTVALKLVHPDRVNDRMLALFAREARAGGKLRHPNLVTVYATGHTGGIAWIAMELVDGGRTLYHLRNLDQLAAPVSEQYARTLAAIFAQIADGMEVAHAGGVIHRDLKPQNILLDVDGRPRITDFGLAKVRHVEALTVEGQWSGTPEYMSPEQFEGRSEDIDHRADVFSIGVMLYEMLAHCRPFRGKTLTDVQLRVCLDNPPELTIVRAGVPSELAAITSKCLQKTRDGRYATMAELAADLRRYLQREAIAALPELLFERYRTLGVLADDPLERVVRCYDTKLDREVLLESAGRGVGDFPAAAPALRQARVLAALDHPNLPHVHDILQDQRGPILVLESFAGESLAQRLKRSGPLSASEVERLAVELASALDAVHKVNAVHRALSTQNVILRPDGSALLRGFRFAKFATLMHGFSTYFNPRARAAVDPAIDRSALPRNPAPEQFGNTPANPSTDLFALGCVLYEAATGQPPFPDLYLAGWRAPIPLASVAPELRASLATLIDSCLARSSISRPASAASMVATLNPGLASRTRTGLESWRAIPSWMLVVVIAVVTIVILALAR